MPSRAARWDGPKRNYLKRIAERTGFAFELERRGSRWASGAAGTIGIMASATRDGERWLLGLDEDEFNDRHPLGLVLLCQSRNQLLDFGLSRQRVVELLPRLSRDRSRGEKKLNLVRRRNQYRLQLPDDDDVDLTAALGDLSWLVGEGASAPVDSLPAYDTYRTARLGAGPIAEQASVGLVRESAPEMEEVMQSGQALSSHFFARVRGGFLEPLDPTELPEGALVRVHVTVTESVPSISALRQILAADGPGGLPRDFAERHDYYAHGQ